MEKTRASLPKDTETLMTLLLTGMRMEDSSLFTHMDPHSMLENPASPFFLVDPLVFQLIVPLELFI